MSNATKNKPQKGHSKTRIDFDLADILKPEEVKKFTTAAEEAGVSTTEHFIDLTLSEKKAG